VDAVYQGSGYVMQFHSRPIQRPYGKSSRRAVYACTSAISMFQAVLQRRYYIFLFILQWKSNSHKYNIKHRQISTMYYIYPTNYNYNVLYCSADFYHALKIFQVCYYQIFLLNIDEYKTIFSKNKYRRIIKRAIFYTLVINSRRISARSIKVIHQMILLWSLSFSTFR